MSTKELSVEAVAEETGRDPDEIKSRVEQVMQEWVDEGRIKSEEAKEEMRRHAIGVVRNEIENLSGSSGGSFVDGDAEELPILTLGFQRKESSYFVTDNDALLAAGIIGPTETPSGFGMFVIDSGDGVDLEHATDVFSSLNTVRGFAAKRQVGSWDSEPVIKKNGQPTYVVETTENSRFEVVDPDSLDDDDPLSALPSEREAKRDLIHNNFIGEEDVVTLQTYSHHVAVKNDNGFPAGFGSDVKRIRGEVVDSMIFESGDGVMTLTDDTVFNEDDISDELISDQMRTPGLQVNTDGDHILGENSVVDVYGYIEQRDDGQYRMQGFGVIPIVEFEYDGPEGGSESSTIDDAAEEGTIS